MNPIRWIELYVQNIDRARKFYEGVFQLRMTKLENTEIEMWAFPMEMGQPGASGALVQMPGVPSGGSTLVYFGCEDCAVEAGRVEEFGGSVHRSKMSIGQYGFIVLAVDTEGNMFGMHSLK